jgi:hypothetical protein
MKELTELRHDHVRYLNPTPYKVCNSVCVYVYTCVCMFVCVHMCMLVRHRRMAMCKVAVRTEHGPQVDAIPSEHPRLLQLQGRHVHVRMCEWDSCAFVHATVHSTCLHVFVQYFYAHVFAFLVASWGPRLTAELVAGFAFGESFPCHVQSVEAGGPDPRTDMMLARMPASACAFSSKICVRKSTLVPRCFSVCAQENISRTLRELKHGGMYHGEGSSRGWSVTVYLHACQVGEGCAWACTSLIVNHAAPRNITSG